MKVIHFSILLGSVCFVISCNSSKPLNCNTPNITKQILKQSKMWTLGSNFVTESITVIQMNGGDKHKVSCKVQINYQHNVFPEKNHQVNYTYQVLKDNQLLELSFYNKKEAKAYQQWINSLPNVIAYQKTRFGPLIIQQTEERNDFTHNQIQKISFNDSIIKPPKGNKYSTITIDKKFLLNHKEAFLISVYQNEENDNNSDHNYFLYINSAESVQVSSVFSYQNISQKNNVLTFAGKNHRTYAESEDVPLYQYSAGQLFIVKEALPDSYYRHKFALLTPAQLLQQIRSDGCLNGDQFYLSDICSNEINGYCFKFNAIKTNLKDKIYWMLKHMCQ